MTDVSTTAQSLGRSLTSLLLEKHGLRRGTRKVIGVAGESGSGKTVTANALGDALVAEGMSTLVLHQDDYFRLPPRANHAHRGRDLANVGPHEVDLDLLRAHIAAFRSVQTDVVAPRVDYPTDRFVQRTLDFGATEVLIVEGTYVLLLEECDVRIFLAATHVETDERRRHRNRDEHTPLIDRILAIEHDLIGPQQDRAQIIIDRDFAIVGVP